MDNVTIAQTYVWHEGEGFFVSTIERDSSAMVEPPAGRFFETLCWEWDRDRSCRGKMLFQANGSKTLTKHFDMCVQLFQSGEYKDPDYE